MFKDICLVCGLSLLLSSCVSSQGLNPEVSDFVQLLVRTDSPTLAEFATYSGECGGESELVFTARECRARGWAIGSKSCLDFSHQRCLMAKHQPSLELAWLRERFSTVGASYQLLDIQSENGPFKHQLVEVRIGENQFLLFHNIEPNFPTGLVVGVLQINGKKIGDYLRDSDK